MPRTAAGVPKPMLLRSVVIVAAVALVAAACGSDATTNDVVGESAPGRDTATADAVPVDQIPSTAVEPVPSALDDPRDPAFPPPLVDVGEIRPGGPPPDGIPPVDDPRFLRATDVAFLADDEPVLALEINGDARAYPIQIMTWHEIVNDTVGDIPVTVSYCPLCNSAIAYDRRLGDRILDFGTSGMLYNSALVMYDRQTESLWSHFTGEAITGHLTGATLDVIPVQTVSWEAWHGAHSDGLVLSRDTGFSRDYGRNPYPGYDDVDSQPFLFTGEVDGRYAAQTRVVGIDVGDEAVAVVLDHLREERIVELDIAGTPIVAWHVPGTSSALDADSIAEGRDVGATGVFGRRADGQLLSFEPDRDGFRDRETNSSWNVLGRAIAGPLAGSQLEPITHVDTFWFAWAAFRPTTEVVG